jgi:hypothetical protein
MIRYGARPLGATELSRLTQRIRFCRDDALIALASSFFVDLS